MMELLADGPVWPGSVLIAFVLGLLVFMRRLDRNWMREALKELNEKIDRYAAEAKADREKGFAEMRAVREKGFAEAKADRVKGFAEMRAGLEEAKSEREKGFAEEKAERGGGLEEAGYERESLYSLLLQVAERTARIEGLLQGRAEIRLERRLQELIKEYRAALSAAPAVGLARSQPGQTTNAPGS